MAFKPRQIEGFPFDTPDMAMSRLNPPNTAPRIGPSSVWLLSDGYDNDGLTMDVKKYAITVPAGCNKLAIFAGGDVVVGVLGLAPNYQPLTVGRPASGVNHVQNAVFGAVFEATATDNYSVYDIPDFGMALLVDIGTAPAGSSYTSIVCWRQY